jgi:N-acetylglucosamine-6-phosphate deacetylase
MTILAGARVVTPEGILDPGWVQVAADGTIAALGPGATPRPADVVLTGGWLVPGFVDMHAHGGGGATVVGAEPEQVRRFAATHLAHGTTSIVASLVSGQYDALERDVAALADLADEDVVVGSHLEGPWIAPQYKGAHDPDALTDPAAAAVDRLLAAGRGTVRMVTIAPELPGALDAIRLIAGAGVVAAVGHTAATYDEVRAAIEAGATVATHLFNAMRPVNHREPGPVVALLEDDRVTVELIPDGVHLHPAVVAFAAGAAGAGRVALITDAMSATGAGDGEYLLGDMAVVVRDGVARLVEGGNIAGSTLTLDVAFRRAVQDSGFTVPDTVRAISTRPAELMGVADRVGSLAAGRRADLCVLDDDLVLQQVWRAGRQVA